MIKQGQLLVRTPSLDVTKIMYFVLLAARLALLVSCASATLGSRVHGAINEHDDAPWAEAEPAEALAGAILRSNDQPFSASHQLPVLLTRAVRCHLW